MRVLFVAPALPHPPRKGFQARAWHQILGLGARHRITLVALTHGAAAAGDLARLRSCCEDVVTVPFRPASALLPLARALAGDVPLQVALYDQPALRNAVGERLARGGFDLVHVQLARLAAAAGARGGVPGVLDLVDALSVNMARRALRDRGPGRLGAGFEARRLAAFERATCASWERVTVATAEDRRAIGEHPRLVVNPNGVDLAAFPFARRPRRPGSIVFTGNLGYFPNREAVRWFAGEVLPLVRRAVPEATFTAVGARPARDVRSLAAAGGPVRVLADVPQMAPHLADAALAVAPLASGSGSSLKVLEAMACGAPVVASPLGTAGLEAEAGRHLLVAEGAADFADAVVRLLREPELAARIAEEARRLVEGRHGWERSVEQMGRIWEEASATRAR